jgi:protein TonB
MAYVEAECEPLIDPSDVLRWSAAAVVVFVLHAFAVFLMFAQVDDVEEDAGGPVVTIELAPLSVAPPAPQIDVAPGPRQLAPEVEERAKEEPQPEKEEPQPIHALDDNPAPAAEVELPPPTPEKPIETPKEEQHEHKLHDEPRERTPMPTAPPSAVAPAPRPAAPAPGRVARPSPAVVRWQRVLVAHLERNKRYPPGLHSVAEGVPLLEFTIDRTGHVLSSRIARSSGSTALDRETLALIRRAEPLPRPPDELNDNDLQITVPVRYSKR